MSISPASFRRRVAYDVIMDFILPALNPDSGSLLERRAKAELLPGFAIAILSRLTETRVRKAVEQCVSMYRDLNYDLPPLEQGKSIRDWLRECYMKKSDESLEDWIKRIALATHCIMAFACLEEAVLPEQVPPLY